MALDVSLLKFLSPLITFIFIWAVLYAVLEKSQILKAGKNVHALISFSVALLFLFTPNAVAFISVFTPWIVVLFIVVLLMLMIFLVTGWPENKFYEAMGEDTIRWTIIIIMIIILFSALTKVFGNVASPVGKSTVSENGDAIETGTANVQPTKGVGEEVRKAIFNGKVLGALLLLIIASFAIKAISTKME